MTSEFAMDLRLARRKAGLTQNDIAHLMGSHQSAVSDLEHGRRLPTLLEIITLSLIYGRSFESLFSVVMGSARHQLQSRILSMPEHVRTYAGTFNREGSIERLARRLADEET